MSTEIHFFVETRDADGIWRSADEWAYEEGTGLVVPQPFLGHRDYTYPLFAILADVRQPWGHHAWRCRRWYETRGRETEPDLVFTSIAPRKGLPMDLSANVAAVALRRPADMHSHTWYTVAELLAFDWDRQIRYYGALGERERRRAKPEHLVYVGERVDMRENLYRQDYTPAEWAKVMAAHDEWVYYRDSEWLVPYREVVGSFLTETLPKLQVLGETENVRIICWYDN